jgi:Immunity protein Imm1
MKIQDMSSSRFDAADENDVDSILLKRCGQGVNAFWIYHEPRKKPLLLILVNNTLANLHYFPDEKHPGFYSIGKMSSLPADGNTTFFMNNPTEREEVPNDAIVPFADALAAAKEFLTSTELPPNIEWFEL